MSANTQDALAKSSYRMADHVRDAQIIPSSGQKTRSGTRPCNSARAICTAGTTAIVGSLHRRRTAQRPDNLRLVIHRQSARHRRIVLRLTLAASRTIDRRISYSIGSFAGRESHSITANYFGGTLAPTKTVCLCEERRTYDRITLWRATLSAC